MDLKNIFTGEPAQDNSLTEDFFTRDVKQFRPISLPVIDPVQITFESDPVLYAHVSHDGLWLVYTTGDPDSSELWIRSADPERIVLPRLLTSEAGTYTAPVFSPDGRYIAFAGNANDAKGDIYILDLEGKDVKARRITGRDTEDGAPCFSADGRRLYFHQIRPGEKSRYLVSMDLKASGSPPVALETGGDASFPVVSPDNRHIAFVSHRDDPSGDIYILSLEKGEITRLTRGSDRDMFPVWSKDGEYIYFTRFGIDTDNDDSVTINDNAIIYRINIQDDAYFPCPLTSASYSAFQPVLSGTNLFFVSTKKGVSNVWTLPLDGEIPPKDNAGDQAALAIELTETMPPDLHLAVLGYYKVMELFPKDEALCARAAYSIGRLYEDSSMESAAEKIYEMAGEMYRGDLAETLLARLRLTSIRAQRDWNNSLEDKQRQTILQRALSDIRDIMAKYPYLVSVQGQGLIENARLLGELGGDASSLLGAIRILGLLLEDEQMESTYKAEAMLLRADLFGLMGQTEELFTSYASIIKEFPDQTKWADQAVERILDLSLTRDSQTMEDQIRLLRTVVDRYSSEMPKVAMGAWNRMGDIYYANDQWTQAKDAYTQVIDNFLVITTQTAAARLSLAEILYQEERFRQALDLYEKEMSLRTYEDYLYPLIREAYIRKTIASAEYQYRMGEIPSAANLFIHLIRKDYSVVEAHRGYIKCAASRNSIPELLAHYRRRLAKDPTNPVTLYAIGLAMTYLDRKAPLKEAQTLILRAIQGNGQVEYFHQTLGYIYEVLESVYGERGSYESALESYQKAFFLNNPENNPENRANLLLNMGNIYLRLGQFGKAFENYSGRFESGQPFDQEDTEIQFYRSFGIAAFQTGYPEQSILAFTRALDLIDKRIEPKRASEILDSVNTYLKDRIISVALKRPESAEKAERLAEIQADLTCRLYEASSVSVSPPPDPTWEEYSASTDSLIIEEEEILADMLALVDQDYDDVSQSLYSMIESAHEALLFPQRIMHLKAEIFDRLGLSYQETENWQKAGEAFEQAYILNERLGLFENLAVNQRSIAYNAYMEAGSRSGRERKQLLIKASEGFRKVKELINNYGVATKEPKQRKKALISLSFEVDLDETGSTSALYGFSSEQEQRLAQAFISRIEIEMGNLGQSRETIKEQLDQYPPEDPVSDKDLYGVSLLYHRAGHLDYALKDPSNAFDHFLRSARLALQLENPISASINLKNMALSLTQISDEEFDREQLLGQLSSLDRETVQLLQDSSPVLDRLVIPSYHNAMGTFYANLANALSAADALITTARIMRLKQDACTHFLKGLEWMEEMGEPSDRGIGELQSGLNLNMAEVALSLGEGHVALDYFKKALEISRQALLPDHEWRATAGLGHLEEALEILESVTILRAGCRSGEITRGFAAMVKELLDEGMEEEAFNLLERLSEIERVNRLAYLFNSEFPEEALSTLRNIYPRLLVIKKLREDLSGAEEKDRDLLQRRLEQEKEILELEINEAGGYPLPSELLCESDGVREQLMIIMGIAAHMEELADRLIKRRSNSDNEPLIRQYHDLAESYKHSIGELKKEVGRGQAPGIMGILWAEPVEAIDVMENLPDKAACVRLFRMPVSGNPWIAFIITSENIGVREVRPGFDLDLPADRMRLLVSEDLFSVPMNIGGETVALSATHLVRSIANRRPFRKRILSLPLAYSAPSGFQVKTLSGELTEEAILDTLPQTNTLLINGDIYEQSSVPTRQGQLPDQSMVMELKKGKVFSISAMSHRISNTSLALLPGASLSDSYTLGQLFSLIGVPTLLMPVSPQADSRFIDAFFRAYNSLSARESVRKAMDQSGTEGQWIQLGFWGMTPEESRVFAARNFAQYAQAGVGAYKQEQYLEALSYFENALDVASGTENLKRYLPDIYRYARESAYMIDRFTESVEYARALADILAREKPDSEEHAEAFLKLGLVQAAAEQYEDSIPVLEEAVEIMENLELGPKQVTALSNLGVVLENATEFDRALVQFQSAAALSESMNKEDMLARQYKSIGRIYDLRMNMYAMARQSYEKAYYIYIELDDSDGMAQSLLDMGRCYRLLGNFKEANDHYKRALDLLEGNNNLKLRTDVRIEQANNAWYQAQYQDAFDIQREVSLLAEKHNWTLEQVMAFNTSGLIWWTLGNHERALRDLEEALALAQTLTIRKDEVATTLNNIGLVYRDMGRHQNALETLDRALAIDRAIRSQWAIAYDLRNKALTYVRMGEAKKALPLFREALVITDNIGNRINQAKVLLGLGEALMSLDRYDEAADSFENALDLARSMSLRETEWRALFGLGKLALKEGDRDKARDLLTSAIEVIEGMRAEIKIDQLKDGFIDNKMDVYETLVSLLVNMDRTNDAFDVAERSRARNLIDLLGNQRLNLSGAIDQEMYDRLTSLRAEIREQEILLAQADKEAEKTVYAKALERINDQYKDLLLEIQARNPELVSLVSVNPLTLSQCRELLDPGVGLLAYYVVPDEVLSWLVTRESVVLFRTPIGKRTLDESILTYRRVIQNLEPFEKRSKELYSWLLSRATSWLDSEIHTLGIVPHRALHYLSFATLYDGKDYIADHFSLFYLPSASVLRYTLERRKAGEKGQVLAIGNPDLGDPGMDLPFAEREVSAIGWNYPDITMLTRERATESWLVQHIREFGIIHLASHGEFDPINPLFSAVKLVKDMEKDGDLETSEVFGLDINADLVVLSACQTGLGKVTGGDEVIGMNRAFLYGGTHAILSTLWRVSDISTAILIKQFYRIYLKDNKADSLRQAMLHVKNRYPHPGYWGAFVLVGDYW